jgi:hypothetical protein
MYLLHVKTILFPGRRTEAAPKWTAEHVLLVHTLLSGLRLYILRREPIAPEKLQHLEETLVAVWSDQSDPPECEFVIHELFPEALDAESPIENQAGIDYAAGLRAIGIPSFTEGLVCSGLKTCSSYFTNWLQYPLGVRPIKLISQTFPRLKSDVDWLHWYWILFDAIHACECALVQAYLDFRRPNVDAHGPVSSLTQPVDILTQLQNARMNIIAAVFRSPPKTGEVLPGAAILKSLNATVIWQEDPSSSDLVSGNHVQTSTSRQSLVAYM